MTSTRARAYARLRDLVAQRDDLFDTEDAASMMRAAETLLFARTWRDRSAVAAIEAVRELTASLLTRGSFEDVASVLDLLEAVAPADLADRQAVAAAA